jgi:CRISPR/Cas system CSM-associated protein Csm3 (group 7 of RAMP superfamily)
VKLFNVRAEAESPLHITDMVSRNNFFSATYIPGPTLRGAFLTKLRTRSEDIFNLGLKNICFSPSYPVCKAGHAPVQSLPSHFAMLRCKICSRLKKVEKAYQVDILRNILEGHEISHIPCPCEPLKHGISVMEKASELYCPACERYVSINDHIERMMSSSIDRKTRTSTPTGMLFSYEYILPRTEFMSQILVTEDDLIKEIPSEMDITVGRGISRGFGRMKLHFDDGTEEMKKSRERIAEALEKSVLVLAAKSPCFHIDIQDGVGFVSKSTIDRGEFAMSLERSANLLGKKVDSRVVEQSIQGVDFRGGTCWIKGWSFKGNIPKPSIIAAAPGSLFIMRFKQSLQDVEDAIALLEFTGIGPHSLTGVNNVYFPVLR